MEEKYLKRYFPGYFQRNVFEIEAAATTCTGEAGSAKGSQGKLDSKERAAAG